MRERFASGEETSLRVGCKINLTLRITGVRPDGWHELDTVFVPLREPFDTLRLSPGGGAGLTLGCDVPGIDPVDNTLTKAYRLFAEASGFRPAVKAALEKGIPHGAGLGGGSAPRLVERHRPRAFASFRSGGVGGPHRGGRAFLPL